ncbi:hypothetical protein RhiirB3_453163 [Rhizophagus irregularis]|nr:hypothetical protein RhiirB3_453163 [Rhizophagus irregularis]
MPGAMVKIILENIYNKTVPRPINLRPGYDMKHVFNSCPQTDNYRPHEPPQQWAERVTF